MIPQKTVFILGAGASKPYGLSTGSELYSGILANLKSPDKRIELQSIGFLEKNINAFRESLRKCGRSTIDAFLQSNTDLSDLGKAAIAQVLIRQENPDQIHDLSEHNGNWYKRLYQSMGSSLDEFGNNKVSFLTYNYDRSLEYFLFEALKHSNLRRPEAECVNAINKIPIVHLHGKLAPLRWEDKNFHREYSPKFDEIGLVYAKQSIKIIHEMGDHAPEFLRARELLSQAERVYFLGFGYDPLNLKRLKIAELRHKRIMGTAIGLERREQQSAMRQTASNLTLLSNEKDCRGLLVEEGF